MSLSLQNQLGELIMSDSYLEKRFDVDFSVVSDGTNGYWDSIAEGTKVTFTKLEVSGYIEKDGTVSGWEVRAFHDLNPYQDGLLYTNKQFETKVHEEAKLALVGLVDDGYYCSGSEQGMQGGDYLSCDVQLKSGVTVAELSAAGFTVTIE